MKPKDRVIFALDVPNIIDAERYITLLDVNSREDYRVGAIKIGLELFMGAGLAVVRIIRRPVMLDLKLHDIPETVERAILRAGDLGVTFVTLHVQQRDTMRRAARAAEKGGIQLLGVTVLTSMTGADMDDLRYTTSEPSDRAIYLARMAWQEGITGFVASAMEVGRLRAQLPKSLLVIPGIRPAGADAGDQKRTGTPAQAIADGADYLVVGRPIRDAPDPAAAADAIAAELPPDRSAS